MIMTTIVLWWVGFVAAIIVATFVFLLRLNAQRDNGMEQWRPSRAYNWDGPTGRKGAGLISRIDTWIRSLMPH
tara:strand:- start:2490 stop:2708 length:219 start_codon:yes stop_codon:yes gene_type:complete